MLNRKARQLIGYDKLVTGLASVIQDEDLEYLETEDLKEKLGSRYGAWEFKDWYRLLKDIKRCKRQAEHENMTAEAIFDGLPWAAQQSAQAAVAVLIQKAQGGMLFRPDETVYAVSDILWNMFYCMKVDLKNTVIRMCSSNRTYSYNEMNRNLLLLDYIKELRKMQWYGHGEVARLRNMEKNNQQ